MSKNTKVRNRLLGQKVMILYGEVDDDMLEYVLQSLTILESRGSPDVELRICTDGGEVITGMNIYDALRRYKGKKTGVVYAFAFSMGAVILQACDDRVCLPHANVLIHNVNFSVDSAKLEDLRSFKRRLDTSLQSDQQEIYRILSARTGKSEKKIRKTSLKDMEMSAKEALAFGLIDRIEGEPDPTIDA